MCDSVKECFDTSMECWKARSHSDSVIESNTQMSSIKNKYITNRKGQLDPMDVVRQFIHTSTPCNIHVAFLTKNGPRVSSRVFTKKIKNGCHVFHTPLNNDGYCYFYIDLLRSPPAGNGLLGSHVTFGPSRQTASTNSPTYYLHNTEYYLSDFVNGVGKKRVCWYEFDHNMQPRQKNPGCSSPFISSLWKTIECNKDINDLKSVFGGVSQTPAKRDRNTLLIDPSAPSKKIRHEESNIRFFVIKKKVANAKSIRTDPNPNGLNDVSQYDGMDFQSFIDLYNAQSDVFVWESSDHIYVVVDT